MDKKQLEDALDWAGIDHHVEVGFDQAQITINEADIARLAQLIQMGSKHS
jgi:hypothetical protein